MNIHYLDSIDIPDWLLPSLVVVIATAVVRAVTGWLFRRWIDRARNKASVWSGTLLVGSQRPLYLLIWVTGLSWSVEFIWEESRNVLFQHFLSLRDLLVITLFCWIFIALVRSLEQRYIQREHKKKLDLTSVIALGRLVRVAVIIPGVLFAMQVMGYSLSGILAFGGLGGLAVGFAAKDMLANFLGGWMIYVDKPFRVGDWISSPDKKIEGTVEYVGWRRTCIMTFASRPLYVPNSTFMNISVENPSRMQNRRIKQVVGLRYCDSDQVEPILADLRSFLRQHEEIDQNQIVMVNFIRFGASSLDCQIYCFTKTKDWVVYLQVQEKVLLETVRIVHSHGADIAFPTRTLDIPKAESEPQSVSARAAMASA